jgi:hypothetical protein
MNNNNQLDSRPPRYIPVTQWNNYNGWPTIAGFRNLIFNRKTNGLDQFKVVKKIGKRVLIDEAAFFAWVEGQQGGQ